MKCANSACGNQTRTSIARYCSRSCHMIVRNAEARTGTNKPCACCGTPIYVAKWESPSKRYCSRECVRISSLVDRVEVLCSLEGCCNIVLRTERESLKTEKHYCSRTCASIAGRVAAQERGKKTGTKPELAFAQWCEKNDIQYKAQFAVAWQRGWKKWYDFYLPDYHLLVEIDGVYWHGKGLSDSELNEQQNNTRRNDIEKNKLACERGFNLLRIWEDEIASFDLRKLI